MRNAERFAIGAIVMGLRKSGCIDDNALGIIAGELDKASEQANAYGTSEAIVIELLAQDVRDMRAM